MGFVWVHADAFLRCVASPFHYFVTTAAVRACVLTTLNGDGIMIVTEVRVAVLDGTVILLVS